MIELGILGPLALLVNDEPVRLGPSLCVLAVALICAEGRLVSDASGRAFARDRIDDLQSRYRNALIARIAADVVALRHAHVTAELECLVRRGPAHTASSKKS